MFDPVSIGVAMSTASAAFGGIKKAFQAGRDIESMTQDLSRWMGAVSDIDNAAKTAKNPGVFKKVFGGGSVEQEAIEAFAAKKKLEEQRKQMLDAVRDHAQAHIDKHRMNVEIYLTNPVGVGEHSEVMDEIEKQLEQMAKYEDHLEMLDKYFNEYQAPAVLNENVTSTSSDDIGSGC